MKDVPRFIETSRDIYGYDHFVNDAGGSVCEIEDPSVVPTLAEHTLILYLRADAEMESELLERQRADPKPLYYPEAFFDAQLATYLAERKLGSATEIEPDDFVQWVFSSLVAHRRPLYEAISRRHGYTVEAGAAEGVRDETDFLDLVAEILDSDAEARTRLRGV